MYVVLQFLRIQSEAKIVSSYGEKCCELLYETVHAIDNIYRMKTMLEQKRMSTGNRIYNLLMDRKIDPR